MPKRILISESKLKKIISNIILQEAGFRKYQKSATSKPGSRKGNLQIAYSKTAIARSAKTGKETEYIAVYLSHVWKDGIQNLINAINNSVPSNIMNATEFKNTVVIRVNIAMKNEIPNYVAKMGAAIKELNDYSEQSIDNLCISIYDEVDEVATSQDIDNAKEKTISNWQEMLAKLEDPQTRLQLLRYQTTNDYAVTYGHILSSKNVKDILDQFPKASFVAEASTWKKIFHRSIKPGAQRIVVTKPIPNNSFTTDALNQAAQECGFDSFIDAKRKTGNSTQVINKIKITAEKNGTPSFIKVIMYDVSETIPPSNPSLDIWTNQIGLSDNLNGELNNKAQEFDDKHNSNIKTNNKQIATKAQESKWKNRRMAIEFVCKRNGISTDSLNNLTDEDFIIKASMLYSEKIAPKYGIIHPQQIDEVKALAVSAIALSCGCAIPSSVSKYIGNKLIDKNLGMAAYMIASDILPQINNYCRAKDIKTIDNN